MLLHRCMKLSISRCEITYGLMQYFSTKFSEQHRLILWNTCINKIFTTISSIHILHRLVLKWRYKVWWYKHLLAMCTRSMYQGQGQVITPHSKWVTVGYYYLPLLLIPVVTHKSSIICRVSFSLKVRSNSCCKLNFHTIYTARLLSGIPIQCDCFTSQLGEIYASFNRSPLTWHKELNGRR